MSAATVSSALTVAAITDFIDVEGDLADSHRLEEWLALWNPDRAFYFVPTGAMTGGRREVAIIRDDFARMTERIRRLRSGSAHAQDPPSDVTRVIGRPRLEPGEEGSVRATANFVCVEVRPDRETLWAGKFVYTIAARPDGDGLELWRKDVHLVNGRAEIPSLTFLI